jgi:hypothetical protein
MQTFGMFHSQNSRLCEREFRWSKFDYVGGFPTGVDSADYGDGRFVAVNGLGELYYSSDGLVWQLLPIGYKGAWCLVRYLNGRFFITTRGDSKFGFSYDGIDWYFGDMPSVGQWYSICYGGGVYVSLRYGSDMAAYSYDGIDWVGFRMPLSGRWYNLAYGFGKFVSVLSGVIACSWDGISWTFTNVAGGGGSERWLEYASGRFVGVRSRNSGVVIYSEDGIDWGEKRVSEGGIRGFCYSGDRFILFSDSGIVYVSYDGIDWAEYDRLEWLDTLELVGCGSKILLLSPAGVFVSDGTLNFAGRYVSEKSIRMGRFFFKGYSIYDSFFGYPGLTRDELSLLGELDRENRARALMDYVSGRWSYICDGLEYLSYNGSLLIINSG